MNPRPNLVSREGDLVAVLSQGDGVVDKDGFELALFPVLVEFRPGQQGTVDRRVLERMGKFNEELIKAGIMLAGDGLDPSKFGKRIHFNGTKRSVTDGPFAETKELVAGFWIWQVRSMEEAIEWAKRCPNPMPGPSDLEIRPIWESEDFGPEIAAGVNELRAEIAKNTE
jgi:hypothetical protein